MIKIKNNTQIEKMRKAGALLHDVLETVKPMIVPGITTMEIDRECERLIRAAGAIPTSKGYEGFPGTICASVDDVVVHGFPSKTPLRQGQIVSIDCTLMLDGWQSDSAFTATVGEASDEVKKLIEVTEKCFWLGAAQAREGNRLYDISHAIQEYAESFGYGVIRDFCGHGIGKEMHEDPSVPNYGEPGRGVRLRAGMTIAIEPMIAMGKYPLYIAENGWEAITKDHSPCSHYEHTVLITEGKPEILTYPGAEVSEASK